MQRDGWACQDAEPREAQVEQVWPDEGALEFQDAEEQRDARSAGLRAEASKRDALGPASRLLAARAAAAAVGHRTDQLGWMATEASAPMAGEWENAVAGADAAIPALRQDEVHLVPDVGA